MTGWGGTCIGIAIALSICAGTGCTRVKTHPDPDQRIKALQKALDQIDHDEQAGRRSDETKSTGVSR